MKNYKISLVMNIIITILVTIGTILMFLGIRFMGDDLALSVSGIEFLKFFTVESNLFIGISSLLFIYYDYLIITKKKKDIPNGVYVLKHAATVCVALTFIVTVFYLAPFSKYDYFTFFKNSNLFFHFIVPVLSIITYLFFENNKKQNKFIEIIGMIPMILYSIFYILNYIINYNGIDKEKYDWYEVMSDSIIVSIATISIMALLTYFISLLLIRINRKVYSVK